MKERTPWSWMKHDMDRGRMDAYTAQRISFPCEERNEIRGMKEGMEGTNVRILFFFLLLET